MTGMPFASVSRWALFRLELQLFARHPVTWIVFLSLFAVMTWGAVNGQRHAEEQRAAVERIRQREADAVARHKEDALRYSQPVAARLPYWQDPTDVAGYMRYGLVAFAVKPPSPLGAIAVGQSKVLPFYLRAELDYIAPPDAAFDFVNPQALTLGEFDLAFVLVVLLPLGLIALGASRLSTERDAGILRLLASQGASPRQLIALKFGVMAVICVPMALLLTGLALTLAGISVPDGRAWGILAVVTLALAGYTLFWIGLTAMVASRIGAIVSYTLLVALWAGFTFLVPAVCALALELLHPVPSRLQYLNDLRHESNLTPEQRDALVKAHLVARPAFAAAVDRLAQIPYATKQIAVQEELERRMLPGIRAMARARADAAWTAGLLRWLSPALVLDAVLQMAAGTDAARHETFLQRSRAYTDELRAFFWPRALKEAAFPTFPCERCAGRLNFTGHDSIPRFVADDPLDGTLAKTVGWMVYLWLLAVVTGALLWRTRDFRF